MKALNALHPLAAMAALLAAAATASDQPPLVLTADKDDLNDMELGCESDCSVMGTVGGVPVMVNQDHNGTTTLKFLGSGALTELTLPSLDAKFLEAADTGSCLAACRAVVKMGEWWAFIEKDEEGAGTVRMSNVPYLPVTAATWQDYWYLYSDKHCTAFVAGYKANSVNDPCPACQSVGPKGPIESVMLVSRWTVHGKCYQCDVHCGTDT